MVLGRVVRPGLYFFSLIVMSYSTFAYLVPFLLSRSFPFEVREMADGSGRMACFVDADSLARLVIDTAADPSVSDALMSFSPDTGVCILVA